MLPFINDKANITIGILCNSASSSITQDPMDGLIRICKTGFFDTNTIINFVTNKFFKVFYFYLNPNPVSTQSYIAVGVQYTSSYIYIAQLLMTTNNITMPNATQLPGSLSGYVVNNSLSIQSQTFALGDLVLKIPAATNFGYYIETSLIKNKLTLI